MVIGHEDAWIREVRTVQLVEGENRVRLYDFSPLLVPDSLHLRDLAQPGRLALRQQTLWWEILDTRRALESLVGRDVDVTTRLDTLNPEQIQGRLLMAPVSASPEGERDVPLFIETDEGDIHVLEDVELRLDDLPEGEFNRVRLEWIVAAATADRYRFELLYRTRGLRFESRTSLRLSEDRKQADLLCIGTVHNETGVTFPRAAVQLQDPQRRPRGYHASGPSRAAPSLYPVGGEVTLEARRSHQLVLAHRVGIEPGVQLALFPDGFVDEGVDPSGLLPVRSRIDLTNTAAQGLGVALPAGPVEVLQVDASRRPWLVARGTLAACEPGDMLFLPGEPVPGLQARREVARAEGRTGPSRNVTVRLYSERESTTSVEVMEPLELQETVRAASVAARLDHRGWALFRVQVPSQASVELTYTVVQE